MIEAFPLQFPINYPRTPKRLQVDGRFKTTFAKARDKAVKELDLLGATGIIISSNIKLKVNGLPYAVPYNSISFVEDTGIALYFSLDNEQKVIACDAFKTLDDNMQAISLSIDALRSLRRWKCTNIMQSVFAGFKALPNTGSFWKVFGIDEKPKTKIDLKKAYEARLRVVHPDLPTGNREQFEALNSAYTTAIKLFD